MGSWYETGFDPVDGEKKRRDEQKRIPFRFFMKKDEERTVIFLDDFQKTRSVVLPNGEKKDIPAVPFCFTEHGPVTINGDWNNQRTCLQKTDPPCPLCDMGSKQYFVGVLTIVHNWRTKEGEERWSKGLWAGKLESVEKMKIQQGRRNGNLQYAKYLVARTSKQKAVIGNDYEFVEFMDPEDILKLLSEDADLETFDYEDLFQPVDKEELQGMIDRGELVLNTRFSGGSEGSGKKQVEAPDSDQKSANASSQVGY